MYRLVPRGEVCDAFARFHSLSPFSLIFSLSHALSLSRFGGAALPTEFETRNEKFKLRRLLSAGGIAACKNDPACASDFYEVIYKLHTPRLCVYLCAFVRARVRYWDNCDYFVYAHVHIRKHRRLLCSRHFDSDCVSA